MSFVIADRPVFVGPYSALQFLLVPDAANAERQTALEQEAELHTDDCSWWGDWSACSCGGSSLSSP